MKGWHTPAGSPMLPTPPGPTIPPGIGAPPMEKTKVLVIEDDASLRHVVCRILAELGRNSTVGSANSELVTSAESDSSISRGS